MGGDLQKWHPSSAPSTAVRSGTRQAPSSSEAPRAGRPIIKLKRPAVCRDCGAHLPVGHAARWYGRYAIYGVGCHEREGEAVHESPQTIYERQLAIAESEPLEQLSSNGRVPQLPAPKLALPEPQRQLPAPGLLNRIGRLLGIG